MHATLPPSYAPPSPSHRLRRNRPPRRATSTLASKQLSDLRTKTPITDEEYRAKRRAILDQM
jgi:hypothetical protein